MHNPTASAISLTLWSFAAPALLVLCGQDAAHGQSQTFPYRAAVADGAAEVIAGPGPHYYATAELPRGAAVEVYEHAGAFCAIRPPEGSFSWAPAADLKRIDGQTAEVTRDNVPSRVGSLLHTRRDAVHVRLHQGERVRVLAENEIDGVRWAQIAPPAGEFRWVRRDSLTTDVPEAPPESAQAATPVDAANATGAAPGAAAQAGWVRAAEHNEHPKDAPPADHQAAAGAEATSDTNQENAAPADASPPSGLSASGATFGQRLNAIEVALARQIAERPTLWRLERLEADASALMLACQNEQQRAAVRDLAGRLDYFAAIANRYRSTRGLAPQVAATKAVSAGATPSGATTPPASEAQTPDSGYDAVGVLRPVVSKRPGAPQFALVDAQGKIVSFITPSPELNLNPLVGTRVGVAGAKGYMPEYRTQHLTARQARTLDAPLRR